MGNKLIGQLIALKFNMAASELGHTPSTGFRDLVYVGPDTAYAYFVGQTVDMIADSADKALACFGGLPAGWTNARMANFLETLNMEFSGPFETPFVERHQHGRHGHQAGGALEHLRKRRPEQRAGGGAG